MKNVLIACEESQTACIEFRKRGFNAFSCDIQPCSGGHPEWHYCGDVIDLMNRNVRFQTYDGENEYINFVPKWDLIIAHPPCTYFTKAGSCRMFHIDKETGEKYIDIDRYNKMLESREFFMMFYNWHECPIAIENPTPMHICELPKETQVIQPWQFGEPYSKRTLLWLNDLPQLKLITTEKPIDCKPWVNGGHKGGYGIASGSKNRSKSFHGIAEAMAEQWGDYINECT